MATRVKKGNATGLRKVPRGRGEGDEWRRIKDTVSRGEAFTHERRSGLWEGLELYFGGADLG